jgi:hypothetical protein
MPADGSAIISIEDLTMNFRLFSPEALAHFRAFTATNARDRAVERAKGSTIRGAHDVSGRELKEQWKRQFGADATMDTGESAPPELDLATVHALMQCVGEAYGDETLESFKNCIEDAFPGVLAAADPEAPDTATSDTADADQPPANGAGAKTRQEAMIAARRDLQGAEDDPPPFPGMPKPGGKMVAQDSAKRFRRAERLIRQADSYCRDFPMAGRIGLL